MFDNIIIGYGGEASDDNLPGCIDAILFSFVRNAVNASVATINKLQGTKVQAIFVNNPGLTGAVVTKDSGEQCIIIPIGIFARMDALIRTLWQYVGMPKIALSHTCLDDLPPEAYYFPEHLKCIFLDDFSDTKEQWSALESLKSQISCRHEIGPDIRAIVCQVVLFLVFHEYTHIEENHTSFLQEIKEKKKSSDNDIEEGLECWADFKGGFFAATLLMTEIKRDFGINDINAFGNLSFRVGFGIAAFLSLFDVRKKFVDAYRKDKYPHPLIRHLKIIEGFGEGISVYNQDLLPLWYKYEQEGWMNCQFLFNHLNLKYTQDAFKENKKVCFLQSMGYGFGASADAINAKKKEADILHKTFEISFNEWKERKQKT